MNLSPTKIFSLWCSSCLTHPNGSDAMYAFVYVCMYIVVRWNLVYHYAVTRVKLFTTTFSSQNCNGNTTYSDYNPTANGSFSLIQEVYYIWPHLVSFSSQFFMAQILWWNVMQKYFILPNLHLAICYVKVQKGVSKRKKAHKKKDTESLVVNKNLMLPLINIFQMFQLFLLILLNYFCDGRTCFGHINSFPLGIVSVFSPFQNFL